MNRDAASSLLWLVLGLGIAWGGRDLGLGALHDPGSGFIFFWLGLIIAGLAVAVLVGALWGKGPRIKAGEAWAGTRWPKVLWVLGGLLLYAASLEPGGFVPATMALLLYLLKVVERQGWWFSAGWAVAATLAAYLVFEVWLGTQLPKGMLGI